MSGIVNISANNVSPSQASVDIYIYIYVIVFGTWEPMTKLQCIYRLTYYSHICHLIKKLTNGKYSLGKL